MSTLLEKLIAPITISGFETAALTRQILHAKSGDPGRFKRCFNWEDLARLLPMAGAVSDEFQYYVKGVQVDTGKLGLYDARGKAVPERLEAFFRSGSGLVVNYLHRRVPVLWDLAVEIHHLTGAQITVGAVASFGDSHTLRKHYDRQDLILLQVDGTKRWDFFGEPVAGSGMARAVDKPENLTHSLEMQAGDVLFVPAGLHHQCLPQGRSLHLGVLIRWPTGEDLMNLLPEACQTDPLIAEQLRSFDSEEQLCAQLEQMKDRICSHVRSLSLEQMRARFREQHRLADGIEIPTKPT